MKKIIIAGFGQPVIDLYLGLKNPFQVIGVITDYQRHQRFPYFYEFLENENLPLLTFETLDTFQPDAVFYSHQGLTYGGLVTSSKITAIDVIAIFESLSLFLKENKIKEVVYKVLPLIYHKQPMQEDIYTLFRLQAEKISCTLSSTIFNDNKILFTESRKSGLRKAQKMGVSVHESDDFKYFWDILDDNLSNNHGVKPVHTLEEIQKLRNLFPENIKLFCCFVNEKIIAGTILFLMDNLIHVQYISANEEGKQSGAIDLLFDQIINNIFSNVEIIDFGHSNEDSGKYLNERLIFQKEGFGGRGVVYEIFHYKL